ncbi:MAG TPA: hypothetical protein VFI34_07570 [Candidatus Limnocylindrales bacterium]|nr:hypothetical protein [Candidatus Limnocylindrales bacterium]
MDGAVTILVAIIGSAGTIVAALIGARQIAGRKSKANERGMAAQWKEQAELASARAELLDEQLADEREAREAAIARNVVLEQQLSTTRHDLDDCSRQRDNAYATIRAIERRRPPRSPSA